MPDDRPPLVILFDGVCNLCNGSVNFIIDRDPRGVFKLAALQQPAGMRLMREHGREPRATPDSIVLIEGGRLYEHSTAALRIVRHLSGAWKLAYAFIVVPRPIRDIVYRWVARNRYRWFGRSEACRVPTPELRARFLD